MSPRKQPEKKKQLDDVYKDLGSTMFAINESKQTSNNSKEASNNSEVEKQASNASTNSKQDIFAIKKKENEVNPPKKFKGFYFYPDMIKNIKDMATKLNMSESEFAEKIFEIAIENINIQE